MEEDENIKIEIHKSISEDYEFWDVIINDVPFCYSVGRNQAVNAILDEIGAENYMRQ